MTQSGHWQNGCPDLVNYVKLGHHTAVGGAIVTKPRPHVAAHVLLAALCKGTLLLPNLVKRNLYIIHQIVYRIGNILTLRIDPDFNG